MNRCFRERRGTPVIGAKWSIISESRNAG